MNFFKINTLYVEIVEFCVFKPKYIIIQSGRNFSQTKLFPSLYCFDIIVNYSCVYFLFILLGGQLSVGATLSTMVDETDEILSDRESDQALVHFNQSQTHQTIFCCSNGLRCRVKRSEGIKFRNKENFQNSQKFVHYNVSPHQKLNKYICSFVSANVNLLDIFNKYKIGVDFPGKQNHRMIKTVIGFILTYDIPEEGIHFIVVQLTALMAIKRTDYISGDQIVDLLLMYSIIGNKISNVKGLFAMGARLDRPIKIDPCVVWTLPIHCIAESQYVTISTINTMLNLIDDNNRTLNAQDLLGWNALIYAVKESKWERVIAFLRKKPDLTRTIYLDPKFSHDFYRFTIFGQFKLNKSKQEQKKHVVDIMMIFNLIEVIKLPSSFETCFKQFEEEVNEFMGVE